MPQNKYLIIACNSTFQTISGQHTQYIMPHFSTDEISVTFMLWPDNNPNN